MILIMAGTTEGLELAIGVKELEIPFIVCVVTEYGGQLLSQQGIEAVIGAKDVEGLIDIINERQVKHFIDCTHPYAEEASINAIEACRLTNIEYLRFQRQSGTINNSIMVEDYPEAIDMLNRMEGNIFLTIGSKNLDIFVNGILDTSRIIARVLPTHGVIEKCDALGLKPHQIIGMKGPFSKDLNKGLISHYNCTVVVTKDSGEVGGLDSKIETAVELGIPCIVVGRPQIMYPREYSSIQEILDILRDCYKL